MPPALAAALPEIAAVAGEAGAAGGAAGAAGGAGAAAGEAGGMGSMLGRFGGQALKTGAMNKVTAQHGQQEQQGGGVPGPIKAVAALTTPGLQSMANQAYTGLLQGGQFG